MKNKLVVVMLIMVIAIGGIGATIFFLLNGSDEANAEKEPTADEVVEASVEIPEITTNLKSEGNAVRLVLKIETDSVKAKEELEKRDFQVKDAVIDILSETNAEELDGKKGRESFKTKVKNKVNGYLLDGKVKEVYITSFNLQ
ncbi:flagellar basal body-associated protein FliL [Bacillus sp. NPDC077027]|uniref:flagellar basal body-associated protein FliL n=1 Tax=Bacillus sp. NPDC077027 TaxID=3390548 RepID=UPI003D084D00